MFLKGGSHSVAVPVTSQEAVDAAGEPTRVSDAVVLQWKSGVRQVSPVPEKAP